MRQIKFRAWDKKEAEWLFGYDTLGGFSLIGEIVLLGELNSVKLQHWNHIELMQYTGLLDKNDNEIYEGDIVQRKAKTTGTLLTLGEVKWIYNGWWISNVYREMLNNNELEVIGNIYENHELLEVMS